MGLAVPPAMRLCRLTSRTDEPNVCRVHVTDVPDVPEVIGRGRGNVIYISGCLTRHWFGAECKEGKSLLHRCGKRKHDPRRHKMWLHRVARIERCPYVCRQSLDLGIVDLQTMPS